MKMRYPITLFILLFALSCSGQERNGNYLADKHALSAPENITGNTHDLSLYLTKPFVKDEQKVRAIFRWVTDNIAYDIHKVVANNFSASDRSQSAEMVLKKRKAVCEGYANLFSELCMQSGILTEFIGGISIDNNRRTSPHAWNAVYVNNTWKLVDVTWAAGGIDERNNFKKHFDDQWYFTHPTTFLKRHYPEDAMWQLITSPVNKKDFLKENLIGETRNFFFNDTISRFIEDRNTDSVEAGYLQNERVIQFDPTNQRANANRKIYLEQLQYRKIEQATHFLDVNNESFNKVITVINSAKKKRNPDLLVQNREMLFGEIEMIVSNLEKALLMYKDIVEVLPANKSFLNENLKVANVNLKNAETIKQYLNNFFAAPQRHRINYL